MNLRKIGAAFGTSIEVAAWDAVGAEVDLSCAGMFAREPAGSLTGGLAHLDTALQGKLLQLRREGHFRGRLGECLLIAAPPQPLAAKRLLLVGLGEPEGWSTACLEEAVRAAATFALALGADSAAFAPGMLDSGIPAAATAGAPGHMVDGLVSALRSHHRLQQLGLAGPPALRRWTFDVGAARLEQAAQQFQDKLAATADTGS